ncbi:hypothetical protein QAD02_000228 [Eretmocerus hayati]|uniref:Uncharacterized protein n=1 Tax=Eretmocerus hayati TaxID=131215 RepID=A0ACC2ND20_9HYME|nr:hypothetical protein QAD02_000228 [Eretmocerus hayati]
MMQSLNSALTKILSGKGYILDSPDFAIAGEDDATTDYANSVNFSEEEMLKHLNENAQDGNDDNEEFEANFVGMSFDDIRPKMHCIYGNEQVLKLMQKEGAGEIVPGDAQVTVDYTAYFEYADQPFDSFLYRKEKYPTYRLGRGQMLPGLEIGIQSMKKGEKSLFLVKPELAYGKLGCPPRILPNAEVLFMVELRGFLDNGQADAYEKLDEENKKKFSSVKKIVEHMRVTAHDRFNKSKVKEAVAIYKEAGEHLAKVNLENDDERKEKEELMVKILENLIICYNRLSKPKLACDAFEILPRKTYKSYFNHGRALYQLVNYDEAMVSLQKALTLTTDYNAKQRINEEIHKVELDRQRYLLSTKRFAQMSLGITGENTSAEAFEKAMMNMCDSFLENDLMLKQELPKGLTPQEQECIERVAAIRCLSITTQTDKSGDQILYLTKDSCLPRIFR